MTKNRYEIIADKATEVFLSNTTNEEQERQFSELVKNEDQNILFAGMAPAIFENMKKIPMESASILLDKFIVNSMLNGVDSIVGFLGTEQKREIVLDFFNSRVPETPEDGIHADNIVNSITFSNFYAAEHLIEKKASSDEIKDSGLNYYTDNYKRIKEVEKAIRSEDLANSVNLYDRMTRNIYSIFISELPESQKEIMYHDSVHQINHNKPENKLFFDAIMKKVNTLEINEANEFLKKAVPIIDSKGYSIGKYAAEIGIPIFEASEIDEHTKQIKNSNKPSLK